MGYKRNTEEKEEESSKSSIEEELQRKTPIRERNISKIPIQEEDSSESFIEEELLQNTPIEGRNSLEFLIQENLQKNYTASSSSLDNKGPEKRCHSGVKKFQYTAKFFGAGEAHGGVIKKTPNNGKSTDKTG